MSRFTAYVKDEKKFIVIILKMHTTFWNVAKFPTFSFVCCIAPGFWLSIRVSAVVHLVSKTFAE
jgi:hypothetical protein